MRIYFKDLEEKVKILNTLLEKRNSRNRVVTGRAYEKTQIYTCPVAHLPLGRASDLTSGSNKECYNYLSGMIKGIILEGEKEEEEACCICIHEKINVRHEPCQSCYVNSNFERK